MEVARDVAGAEGCRVGLEAQRQDAGRRGSWGARRGGPAASPTLSRAAQSSPTPGPRSPVRVRPGGNAFRFLPAPVPRMPSHGAERQWGGGVRAGGFKGSPSNPSLPIWRSPSLP